MNELSNPDVGNPLGVNEQPTHPVESGQFTYGNQADYFQQNGDLGNPQSGYAPAPLPPKRNKRSVSLVVFIVSLVIATMVAFVLGFVIGAVGAVNYQEQQMQQARAQRAEEISQAQGLIQQAYTQCVTSPSDKIFIKLGNDGSIVMNNIFQPQFKALQCILGTLAMPYSIRSEIDQTRALDGRQQDEWNMFKASWGYHPEKGLNLVIQINTREK